jgi:benzylsuccinate CoA-transferase BbsF subunit
MTGTNPLPLDGVRVLDLTWVIAGPVCTKLLADQGADVIKVESAQSMDPIRMSGQWLHRVNTAPDGGATFSHYNRNKRSITLNLKHPRGRDLLIELARHSDAIVNNYSAGAMERLGLGYDVLRAANPRLVVAELSGMGQTGPYARYVAFGMTLMALSGAYELTGYPEGIPFMPGYTFTDFAGAAMGAFAITSALRWRNLSGEGQYLDLGQFQMGAALFAEEQFEYLVTGRQRLRQGNRDDSALVHGVYRCAGRDEWCVIAARTDDEWDALVSIGVIPAWLDEKREQGILAAANLRDEIDTVVEAWTRGRSALSVMLLLQEAGVEAARVQTALDLVKDDAQLAARGWFEEYTHISGEQVGIDGMPFRMSATPAHVRSGGPLYGADNRDVFGGLLGLSDEQIRALEAEGVIA